MILFLLLTIPLTILSPDVTPSGWLGSKHQQTNKQPHYTVCKAKEGGEGTDTGTMR